MPMRRDQPLPDLCPASALRSPSRPWLNAALRRAVQAAFATMLLSAAACSSSHSDNILSNGTAGSGSAIGRSKGVAAICKEQIWQPLEGIEPVEPVDYIAMLTVFEGASAGREGASQGTPCKDVGMDSRCALDLAAAKSSQGLTIDKDCGKFGKCREFVVTTSGEEVKRYATREEVIGFLGEINTPHEALFVAEYDRYGVLCAQSLGEEIGKIVYSGAKPTTAAETADGFEATVLKEVNDCPITYDQVVVRVSRTGELKEVRREHLQPSNVCAGRRPEGWVAQHAAFSGSMLADHFARMAELEAASVAAFEVLAVELEYHGAPAELIERLHAAAHEEVGHARATADMARVLGAEPKPPQIEPRPIRALEEIALDNAVEGCVRETFGAAVGCYQAEAARDRGVAALMRQVSTDEVAHAALAFDLHAWILPRLSAAAGARVLAARAAAIEALACEIAHEPSVVLRELAGLPGPIEASKLHATLRDELWA
jgi:hypothetical protein